MHVKQSFYAFLVLLLATCVDARHSTLRNDSLSTLPDQNASFMSQGRSFWDHEPAQREGEHFIPFVYSGGFHGISSTLTAPAMTTVAYMPERVNQTSTIITYAAAANDVCWTIISSDNDGITGWTRVGSGNTGAYYYQCEGDTTPNEPTLPANSAWLMGPITVAGNAITAVQIAGTWRLQSTVSLTSNTTFSTRSQLLFSPGALLSYGTNTLTINGRVEAQDTQQILSGTGRVIFGRTSVPHISAMWWGALGDNSNADYAPILTALGAAAERATIDDPGACVYFPELRVYRISSGLPLSRKMCWFTAIGRRPAKILHTGTGSAIYSATYSAGTFTDNLNLGLAAMIANNTGADESSIHGLIIEQTGTITGNAPSGTTWNAIVHLNGASDSSLVDLRVDGTASANIDGLRLRNSFRSHLVRPYVVRGSVVTGGIGINILEQTNASFADNPSVQGQWTTSFAVDNNGDVINSYTLINPRLEGSSAGPATRGFQCSGRAVTILGGYIERTQTPFNLGVIGGEACIGANIQHTFIGTDANTTYLVRLNNVQQSRIAVIPQPSYTVSSDEFLSGTVANGNIGNVIEWYGTTADTTTNASLGLADGANVVRHYGTAQSAEVYQEYLTTTATLNRMEKHVNRVIAEDFVRIGTVTFASLGADSSFTLRACSDCQVTSSTNNVCAASGAGALAIRIGADWRCFALQN